MYQKIKIAHQTPGRIRLKIPEIKADLAALNAVRDMFASLQGIDKVVVKPESGSIVLTYDPRNDEIITAAVMKFYTDNVQKQSTSTEHKPPETSVDDIASRIESEARFLSEHSEIAKAVFDFFARADRELKLRTGNMIDLKIVLAVGLTIVTFLEIGAAAATPMWVTLALFTLNHFLELRSPSMHAHPARAA